MDFRLQDSRYGVVLVTVSSQAEGEAIATALVKSRLAACVNMTPVHSIYVWNAELQRDQEWQLIIKTELSLFTSLESKIRELHSYETPEIIAVPILSGSLPYLQWISEQVQQA